MAIKTRVLFLCTTNSCRTQIAEALLRTLGADEFDVVSAGAEAGHLDAEAVTALAELGIDIAGAPSKSVDPFLGKRFTYVITLCDRTQEQSCPIFPGALWRQTWPVAAPTSLTEAGMDHAQAVRSIRDDIKEHVVKFLEEQQAAAMKGRS